MEWLPEKPTEPGCYLTNRGDVVTEDSLRFEYLRFDRFGELVDDGSVSVKTYHPSWKFMKLDIEELNRG